MPVFEPRSPAIPEPEGHDTIVAGPAARWKERSSVAQPEIRERAQELGSIAASFGCSAALELRSCSRVAWEGGFNGGARADGDQGWTRSEAVEAIRRGASRGRARPRRQLCVYSELSRNGVFGRTYRLA